VLGSLLESSGSNHEVHFLKNLTRCLIFFVTFFLLVTADNCTQIKRQRSEEDGENSGEDHLVAC
jgi:hypothetical protein